MITKSPTRTADVATRRPRARRGEGDALREEILDATQVLLLEAGTAEDVSIRAVAEKVGRTPPSIYLHFADKDALIHSVCDRLFDSLADRSAAAQAGSDDPVERICRCAHAYVDFALEFPAVYRILFLDNYDWDEMMTMDHLKESVAFRSMYDNVVDAFESGVFKSDGGPDTVSILLWMSIHGIASLLLTKQSFEWPPVDDLVDQMIEQQLHGLLAE